MKFSRRNHMSTKVPNVKIRPAPANVNASKKREASPMNAMDQEMFERAWAGAEGKSDSSFQYLRASEW